MFDWREKVSSFLLLTVRVLNRVADKIRPLAFQIKPRLFSTEEENELKQLASSLLNDEQALSKLADDRLAHLGQRDEEMREVVRAYYYTKSAIALCEARGSTLTIQVFNEFRSAVDHYTRAITADNHDNDTREAHLRSTVGHIQRAFLDVAKLGCASIRDAIDQVHSRFGNAVIGQAKEGEYGKKISSLIYVAENALYRAKIEETRLGDDAAKNIAVRDMFFEALTTHVVAHKYQQKHIGNLYWATGSIAATRGLRWLGTALARFAGVIAASIASYAYAKGWISLPFSIPFLGS